MNPNSSCKFLSNGLKLEIQNNQKDIEIKPCCKWYGPGVSLAVDRSNYQDFRNHIGHQQFQTLEQCHICVQAEKIGAKSMRQVADLMIAPDSEWGDPTHVEIQIDTTCNAACVMCGPNLSSLWRQELGWQKNINFHSRELDPVEELCRHVDIQKIRSIAFVGGEPMLSRQDISLLEKIEFPELVTLAYVTNGSIYPPQQKLDLWKRFKKVRMAISIDGINSRYNYIRYPLQWSQIQENLKLMQSDFPTMIFSTIYTANILNFYYFEEFDHWFSSAGLVAPVPVYNIANGILDPTTVPVKLYQLIVKKYGPKHFVTKTVKKFSNNNASVIEYLDQIDQRRSTDWRLAFPEVAKAFESQHA